MIGTIITMLIFMVVFSMSVGVILGKLFWTPPAKGVK